jgi:mono/diheme cytochrome c family protein
MSIFKQTAFGLVLALAISSPVKFAVADEGHDDDDSKGMMEEMREAHGEHEHGHDFEAVEEMSPEQLDRMIGFMQDIGLAVPPMNAARGRELYTSTGCVVCHSVNGVGGEIGPSLDAANMPSPMNAFEFAARMWRGAAAMTAMQEDLLGGVINLTGQDLADLVAFAHDVDEQNKLTNDQIPEQYRELLGE